MVRALAVAQDGVVTRKQLLEDGVSRSAINRAVTAGRLHSLHAGVYAVVAPELLGEDAHLIAALLAAAPGAFLSHGTAAWRWQITPAPPTTIELGVPHRCALRRGHPGSANLRAALHAHAPGHGQAKSRLERRFRTLLVRHRVELPERNQPLGPWIADCIWRDRRVVVELDGRQHARPHQADRDDDRDLWMRRNRYVPRRYGTRQVDEQPGALVADLLAAFAEAVTLGHA